MNQLGKVYVVVAEERGREGTYGSTTTLIGICFSPLAAEEIRTKYLDDNKPKHSYSTPQSLWTAEIHCVMANESLDEILTSNYE